LNDHPIHRRAKKKQKHEIVIGKIANKTMAATIRVAMI